MRSFLGLSNHGPYVGVSISRRHKSHTRTKHYARPASNVLGAAAAYIQAQKNLEAARARVQISNRAAVEAFEAIDAHHEAERARIDRKLARDLAALDRKAAA